MKSDINIETNPTPDQIQYLEDRLYEFNLHVTGIADGESLAFLVQDERKHIVGGICGYIWGNSCELRQFWVDESRRKCGLGNRLLQKAEAEARRRGCKQIILSTYSFQAPNFYMKRGFVVVAAVEDHPKGHKHLLLQKKLQI